MIVPALIICCKDYRYIQPIQYFVKRRLGVRWYDLKATAGGVRAMLDAPAAVRRWILSDIDLVYRLHGVRRIILVHHEDCAAYGGSAKLGSLAAQKVLHNRQLRRAAAMLKKKFKDVSVEGWLSSGFPKKIKMTRFFGGGKP